jgi:hypothetical protein
MVDVNDAEGIGAIQTPDGLGERIDKVTLVVALDEMGDQLRVGLGTDDVAGGTELLTKLHEVLDDAVVNDRDPLRAITERMSVLIGRLSA